MIDLYFNLVKNKKRTCDIENQKVKPVPSNWINEVSEKLKAEGYDLNGVIVK